MAAYSDISLVKIQLQISGIKLLISTTEFLIMKMNSFLEINKS